MSLVKRSRLELPEAVALVKAAKPNVDPVEELIDAFAEEEVGEATLPTFFQDASSGEVTQIKPAAWMAGDGRLVVHWETGKASCNFRAIRGGGLDPCHRPHREKGRQNSCGPGRAGGTALPSG